MDICAYGNCIDYFITGDRWSGVLPEMLKAKGVARALDDCVPVGHSPAFEYTLGLLGMARPTIR